MNDSSGVNRQRGVIVGCIADDFTGATDLGNNLVRAGMRVVEMIGVPGPQHTSGAGDLIADAIIVALKSRTAPKDEAVTQSLEACRWLREQGAQHIYFKICSTFDSTPRGNIGPVMEALMEELDCAFSVVTPAFPESGRTVFHGHLFVGDVLLSESGMRHHPLTPMTDSNLVRVLQEQLRCKADGRVGLIAHPTVAQSSEAVRRRMDELQAEGCEFAVADAICNDDLMVLGEALRDAPLVTAGSGLAMGLARSWGFRAAEQASGLPEPWGYKAILSGSCSEASRKQVGWFLERGGAARALDVGRLVADLEGEMDDVFTWVEACWRERPDAPVLVYSTADPDAVEALQGRLGTEKAGAIIERALSLVARGLVERGAGMVIVAGGETSGACVQALGITQLQVGSQIDAGVPWCHAAALLGQSKGLHIALKSGNFGSEDFFVKAFDLLARPHAPEDQ